MQVNHREEANPAAESASQRSLYDQLGGRPCLERVHKRFYDKVFTHRILGVFFANKNRQHQEEQQNDFMAAQFGGPKRYGGRLPDGAHCHMFITEAHFALRHEILAEALDECGIDRVLREHWLAIDLSFKKQIVKASIDECQKRYTNDNILSVPTPGCP